MLRIPRHPGFWLACLIVWFATLWWLSSASRGGPQLPPIAFGDKIAHFGYFFGGGGLMASWLFFRDPPAARWLAIIASVMVVMGGVGWLDEWHQTFTPGRSGNDLYDWLADFLGATSGALVFKAVHRRFK